MVEHLLVDRANDWMFGSLSGVFIGFAFNESFSEYLPELRNKFKILLLVTVSWWLV